MADTRPVLVVLPAELDGAKVFLDDVGGGHAGTAAVGEFPEATVRFGVRIGAECPSPHSFNYTFLTVEKDGWRPYRQDGVRVYAGAVQIRIGVPLDPERANTGYQDTWLPALQQEHAAGAIIHPRRGLVRRGPGRSIVDDDGEYYPFDTNIFFNALYWLGADEAKLRRGLAWARRHNCDGPGRAFLTLNFGAVAVDPRWPDWEARVARYIAMVAGDYQMRASFSVVAPDPWFRAMGDYEAHAHRCARVLNPMAEQIRDLEICNEASVVGLPKDVLRRVTEIMRAECRIPLVGASSDIPDEPDDRSKPQQVLQTRGWGCNQAVAQMARTGSDFGWFEVAQPPADWRRYPDPYDHNEPGGPGASGHQTTDPIKLATYRAVSIMFGGAAFTLHNGGGIDGVAHAPDAIHPPVAANPDETPGIDAIMRAVRGVDQWLPPGATDGRYQDMRLAGAMLLCDSWSRGAPQGAYRGWFQLHDDGTFWAVLAGIRGEVALTPAYAGSVEAFDILSGSCGTATITPGQAWRVAPVNRTPDGYGTVILRGQLADLPPPVNAVPWMRAEWGAWFDQVKSRHALSTLTQAACEIYDAELWLLTGEGQKDSNGQYRGRGYCPTGNPSDLYGKAFDMGSFDGPLVFIPRF